MKANFPHKTMILFSLLCCIGIHKSNAQDSVASSTILSVRYFLAGNKVPYVSVTTKKKTGRKLEAINGTNVNVYFNEAVPANLLGKTITGITGEGRVALPASFKATWDSLNEFKFIAETDSGAGSAPLSADVTVKKAILVIDTASADGIRTITAQLKERSGNDWVAVKDIEMKLGIKRSLGNLTVGDAETYTADSTGTASAEFKKDSMPGDESGNIILVAKVEDNDVYGNLVVERSVPWGKAPKLEQGFWHRSLWSTGDRAPIWLLAIAFGIILGVWGVIMYLIRQLFRIRKMGREASFANGNIN